MRIAIYGLAKTGTTGLYRTLKQSTQQSDAEYLYSFEPKGPKIWEAFFTKAEPTLGMVTKVMLKPKYLESEASTLFDRQIMIVRDPRDRLVSALLFKALSRPQLASKSIDALLRLLRTKEQQPQKLPFLELHREIEELGLGGFNLDAVIETLQYQVNEISQREFHVIHYEDFVAGRLSALSAYLDLPLENSQKRDTTWLKHIERSKGSGEWHEWFTQSDVDALRPYLQSYMEKLGYEDEWELPSTPAIDPKNSSEHVKRNFEDRVRQASSANVDADDIESQEDLDVVRMRAEDGKPKDILRLARALETGTPWLRSDADQAFYWYETGLIFGSVKCRESARRMFNAGFRPRSARSKAVRRWLN